ncbi:hypothetical protein ACOSP7_018651 [Xanthoceras sorbifolium]
MGYSRKGLLQVQDQHVFYQQNESCDTILTVQHDDLESQLFHRDDVNADIIEDPSLREERKVTTQNMDDFICNEDEEDETNRPQTYYLMLGGLPALHCSFPVEACLAERLP